MSSDPREQLWKDWIGFQEEFDHHYKFFMNKCRGIVQNEIDIPLDELERHIKEVNAQKKFLIDFLNNRSDCLLKKTVEYFLDKD